MSRTESAQFNVRSAFARKRAHELAQRSGMTATQVVEEALRSYVPSSAVAKTGRLIQRGAILVKPADDAKITAAEAEAALEAVREREDED
jgi:hypothetical protein